jgi:hypothetical protein
MLRPGGKLFVTVPAYDFLWSKEDEIAGHYLRYTCKNLVSELRDAGFVPVFRTYFFSWLVMPILLLRVLPRKLGLKKFSTFQKAHSKGLAMQKLLRFEIQKIRKQKQVAFGSSVLGLFINEDKI